MKLPTAKTRFFNEIMGQILVQKKKLKTISLDSSFPRQRKQAVANSHKKYKKKREKKSVFESYGFYSYKCVLENVQALHKEYQTLLIIYYYYSF